MTDFRHWASELFFSCDTGGGGGGGGGGGRGRGGIIAMTALLILIPGDELEGQVQLEKISTLHSDHDIAKFYIKHTIKYIDVAGLKEV